MTEIDDNLLTEFLEGKLDEQTGREIETWYGASAENRRRLEALYFVLFAGERLKAASEVNTDRAFRALQRRIELRRQKTRPQWYKVVTRYAAVLIAGALMAGLYIHQHALSDRPCTVYAESSDCRVSLPDGSVVNLARHSELSYSASFRSNDRTVHLVGEAFFDIRTDNGNPFSVTTEHDAKVIVKGTKFNLKAYSDNSDIETVLVEGAVDFLAADRIVSLKPGQKVSFSPGGHNLTIQTVNVETELSSRERTFQRIPLSQIITVIENAYGCDIALGNKKLSDILFTGTLDFNRPVNHILEVLTLSTNTRFAHSGDRIVIRQ